VLVRAAAVLALALLAGACEREPSAEDRAAAEATSPTPIPADPPPPPAAARAEVLTAEGYGPLRIGMSRAEVVQALGEDSEPNAVGGPEPEACDQFRPARAPRGLLVMIEGGRLTRISLIRDSALKTDRGFGVGDAASAVKAAYGSDAAVTPHKYEQAPAEYVTVWSGGPRGAAYVPDPAARGVVYEIGGDGRVSAVHAGGPSIQYVEGCS
jgi:hypothetical protein